MTDVFLNAVHLTNFRTFGSFTLDIAPGPGLTLLVGTNGLGKSSFFDGLEWCLTGGIRRFETHVGRLKERDYLTRRGAPAGSHEVGLSFTEGDPLVRTERLQPSISELRELLKQPQWTDIKDLGAYLAFTHFLGQASQQRFTSRAQSEQWEALKGPSGIDRLEAIRTALRGRSTMSAFRRRSEREELEVTTAQAALEQWRAQSLRLADLTARAAAAGAQSEPALIERLNTLESRFDITVVSAAIADRLTEIRSSLEELQLGTARDRGDLDALRHAVARFHAAERDLATAENRKRGAEQSLSEAVSAIASAEKATTVADHAARDAVEAVAQAEAEQERLQRIRAAIVEHDRLETEVASARAAELVLVADHESRRRALDEARQGLTASQEKQKRLAELDSVQAALQRWADRASALAGLEATAATRQATADAATHAAEDAHNALDGLKRSLQAAFEAERAGAEKLSSRQRDSSDLAGLLSQLTAHIGHDDTDCPVCATSFEPGRLLERARGAIAAQDSRLAEESAAQDVLRERHGAAARQVEEAEAAISASETAVAEAEVARNAVALEREAIAKALGLDEDADFAGVIASRLAALLADRSRELDLDKSIDVASAQSEVDRLTASIASIEENRAAAGQRRARGEASLVQTAELLSDETTPWSLAAVDALIDNQSASLLRLREHDISARAAAAAARVAEDAARQRTALAQAEVQRAAEAIAAASEVIKEVLARWAAAGMDAPPSEDAIAVGEAALDERSTAVLEGLAEASTLASSHEALLEQEDLRDLAATMDAAGGAGASGNPAAHEQRLEATLASHRAALKLSSDTRAAVVAYAEHLKTEAEGFSTQFLLPLNDLIDAFNRALLSTPGESVQFKSAHTVERTSLAMRLRYADPIENAQYQTDLPPQLVLSEGQMAANGFSILCAASTAYRWSRWRALLLDDPLQHNDIIHAAAFVDVMRNLVEIEGYQLLMSSHKRDEGEFIARKFDAAGLPCTVVELTAASKDGVRWAPPRHNAAARRLLNSPETRFGKPAA
ncbi:AAA family ATPase [Novosphingobium sp. RL4]|uniref:AAA family ATPase n=1 Tax=Novosphingobium sp. RL4 TaxID=3109595 RepID=UPI002D780E81|nr:AAA family ATPase [Novosphingobium sp. RL4]WRT93507.1 AAA family ATPase [Novosphingobium sp. RL4]